MTKYATKEKTEELIGKNISKPSKFEYVSIEFDNELDDDDYDGKNYLDILRLDLLFFNILRLKKLDGNEKFINIRKYITQEDIHAMKLNWDVITKRIHYNVGKGYLIIRDFDENEVQKKEMLDEFNKKCRVNNLRSSNLLKSIDGKIIIDKKQYFKYFFEIKITQEGIKRVDEINEEIKSMVKNNSRLHKNINKIKSLSDKASYLFPSMLVFFAVGIVGLILFSNNNVKFKYNNDYYSASILNNNTDGFYEIPYGNNDYEKFENFFRINYQEIYNKIDNLKDKSKMKKISENEIIFRVEVNNGLYSDFKYLIKGNIIEIESSSNF